MQARPRPDHRLALSLVLSGLIAGTAAASTPVPFADVYTKTAGASIGLGAEMGGFVYFEACPDSTGCELYRSPIGGSGDELVADLSLGGSSNPDSFAVVGGALFFRAFGTQLWKTDGTPTGTEHVRSFAQLPEQEMGVLGSEVAFRAEDSAATGRELWTSDGTTTTLHDLCSGSCDGDPTFFTPVGSRVFFRATDGSGAELWKYEAGGASQIGDIHPAGGSFPFELAPFAGGVIFGAADATELGLWTSDGSGNTKIAGSSENLFGFEELVVAGSLAFFDGLASGLGQELWVSNGTTGGTVPVLDIRMGSAGSNPEDLTAVGSSVFFTADDGSIGRELWISVNGVPGTTLPLEIVAGASGPSFFGGFRNLDGGRLFFFADDGSGTGREPWISDGTPGGTTMIEELTLPGDSSGLGDDAFVAQNLAFFPSSALDDGEELWRSDGSAAGTLKVTELDSTSAGPGVETITPFGGIGYFCADDGFTGEELWRTDGTTAGTYRLEDLDPGPGSGCDRNEPVTVAGGTVFFVGSDGTNRGLWRTNGGVGGATLLKAFSPSPPVRQLTEHGGLLFFVADDIETDIGAELWRSNGTVGGTVLVEDVHPGSVTSNIGELTSTPVGLLFSARWFGNGEDFSDVEVFVSDGTGGTGTGLLKDIRPGTAGSYPGNFGSVGSLALFTATDSSNGEEVWVTDGTTGNTKTLENIGPGSDSGASSTDGFAEVGGWAYFAANDGSSGIELWRTDGTTANTELFADLRAGGSSDPRDLAVVASRLYFSADDGTTGREPWTTDGFTTDPLGDLNPTGTSNPREFFPTGIGSGAWFQASPGALGGELWTTDGSSSGTSLVADLHPDDSGLPESFADLGGGTIVFSASALGRGDELWTFADADCGDAPDEQFGTLLASSGPCHRTGENAILLGATRDVEDDGQPSAGADGDDGTGTDDEDGVAFTSLLEPGETASLSVTVTAGAILQGWFDWTGDGDWNDEEEHAIVDRSLGAGTHTVLVDVPAAAVVGPSMARFRVDTVGLAFPGGPAMTGEVEDYAIDVVQLLDYGDAPDPLNGNPGEYPTLLANDGARHGLVAGVHLGAGVDGELDGQPNAAADGDGDDDGVVFTSLLVPGAMASVDVTASTAGQLYAWIDFDGDGVWNDSEELILDAALVAGVNSGLSFPVPAGATSGATYARFRFDTAGDAYYPTGAVEDGEVEDYLVGIGPVADLSVVKTAPETAIPGESIEFTITAANAGPSAVVGATATDLFASELIGCEWTCSEGGGASCGSANGFGDITETVDLPVGGSVVYAATCDLDPGETGDVGNTATVSVPSGVVDTVVSNDASSTLTTLEPTADLGISKTDGVGAVELPATLTYTIEVTNPGPSHAFDALVDDVFPAELTNVGWTCLGEDGGACVASGLGDIAEVVDLPAGASVVFTASADVDAEPPGLIENTATVTSVGVVDPNAADDSATDSTEIAPDGTVVFIDGFESGDTTIWSSTSR